MGKPQATGKCWCGCGEDTHTLFKKGHDKVAESAIIELEYGSVAEFMVAHGYGPGGKNARAESAMKKGSAMVEWAKRATEESKMPLLPGLVGERGEVPRTPVTTPIPPRTPVTKLSKRGLRDGGE